MSWFARFEKEWLRPSLFFGNNPISLIGGAITSASALTLIGFWVVDIFGHGGSTNPYLGIIFDLFLPALFVFGLLLIPIGMWLRHRHLVALDRLPQTYPKIDFADPIFRHGINFVLLATFINFVIVGTASYRGVAYMDTPSFCGQACHVMAPEWSAYHAGSHASVACTECHVAPGVPGYLHAKMNGSRQLFMVLRHSYPSPIMAGDRLPPASVTCFNCHNPDRSIGDKLRVKKSYGDDEKNSVSQSLVVMHVGGRDQFGRLSGIHGAHLGHVEFIATGSDRQTINFVSKRSDDGSTTDFAAASPGPATGQRHEMDCIDCHNRPAHSFDTPEDALNRDMAAGTPSASLPFVHKQGLALLQASYTSDADASAKITSGLEDFYQSRYPDIWTSQHTQVEQAAKALAGIYNQNVFLFMKVTWGTHPNNIGHTAALTGGCMRCHDGNHTAKNGKSISNDCAVCHNLVAVDEPSPRQLADIGLQ